MKTPIDVPIFQYSCDQCGNSIVGYNILPKDWCRLHLHHDLIGEMVDTHFCSVECASKGINIG